MSRIFNKKYQRFVTSVSVLFVLFSLMVVFGGTVFAQRSTINRNELLRIIKPDPQKLKLWNTTIDKTSLPKSGCFTVRYPAKTWREVGCITAPSIPMVPRSGVRPLVVGDGDDISAQAPSGTITQAVGSFDSVTGVTSASSPIGNVGAPVANAYSLQLNTDFFASTACAASPNPSCRGWEQFIFYNDGAVGTAFIQYWLLQYNDTCPAGWTQFSFTGSTDIYCWINSSAVATPNQPITNLENLRLTGNASSGSDSVAFSTGSDSYSVTGIDAVNAAAGWTAAEFNAFGAGGGADLAFNAGSTIVPRTRIFYGGTEAPNCLAEGFTGETNNLSFGPDAPSLTPPGPAVFFTESSAGGAGSFCSAATTIGDTHLHTFGGLFYDFQATGDFILAKVDPDFVVQSRQVSGAPTWPNASVNKAVATQMGDTKVAVCLNPKRRLVVNNEVTNLSDGTSHVTADGVTIWRKGNVYTITSEKGNALRATVHNTWINADVSLGKWPSTVTGLLANVNENSNQIATRNGFVLTAPFSFQDLYNRYADSWRVPHDQSLLSACSDLGTKETIEIGVPKKPFYAANLKPEIYQRARRVCTNAGVGEGALLDACILDVAVIGDKTAADVYTNIVTPNTIGIASIDVKPVSHIQYYVQQYSTWLGWILVGIIVILLLYIFLTRKKSKRRR